MFMTLWSFIVACNILWLQCLKPAGSVTVAGEEMIYFKKYRVYWIIGVLLY
jgi:hypothetical protein